MDRHTALILEMTAWERGCPQRIQHFLKVLSFAELIGGMELLDVETLLCLRTAAVVHDIGIRPSLEKYGDAAGPHQEKEGPPAARPMLEKLGYDEAVVARVCALVGRHHSYGNIQGADHQILVEADFLVNIFEGGMAPEAAQKVRRDIFRTAAGRLLFDRQYP